MSEVAFWNPKQANGNKSQSDGIERTSFVPDVTVAARYEHEVTIHQGRIERILEENLRLYSERSIVRSTHFVDFHLDKAGDNEYPLLVEVEEENSDGSRKRRSIRAKHLVGADGAHSSVRRRMGLKLEGETTDHIWGVVDFVAETDFPDIRKRSAIHSDAGSVMVIPRERIYSGHYLTRLYVQVKDDEVSADVDVVGKSGLSYQKSRERRAAITLEYIFEQARRVFAPYDIRVKEGTDVDWWAAYQIGQRMTSEFSMKDDEGVERVFIVGDGKGGIRKFKSPTMANVTGSLSHPQSESRTRHECVHDGLVQFVLEACAQSPWTRSQDAHNRRVGHLRTRATHRRATAHRVRFKVLIHVLGTDWCSRGDDQQPHTRAVLESIQ
jgi:phenol 2-monooxygenase (NADPH)